MHVATAGLPDLARKRQLGFFLRAALRGANGGAAAPYALVPISNLKSVGAPKVKSAHISNKTVI